MTLFIYRGQKGPTLTTDENMNNCWETLEKKGFLVKSKPIGMLYITGIYYRYVIYYR